MYDIRGLKSLNSVYDAILGALFPFPSQQMKLLWKCSQDLRNERPEVERWENRLSFHNLLSISGGKKVEYLWESFILSLFSICSFYLSSISILPVFYVYSYPNETQPLVTRVSRDRLSLSSPFQLVATIIDYAHLIGG